MLSVIAHYINLGYPCSELLQLDSVELQFFAAAWELEEEREAARWQTKA